jgi:hypothetical protein
MRFRSLPARFFNSSCSSCESGPDSGVKLVNCNRFIPVFNRRDLLRSSANGFGFMALASMLGHETAEAAIKASAASRPVGPLSPRAPHFAPKAKRVIFLFMHGGPSQVDTFETGPHPR